MGVAAGAAGVDGCAEALGDGVGLGAPQPASIVMMTRTALALPTVSHPDPVSNQPRSGYHTKCDPPHTVGLPAVIWTSLVTANSSRHSWLGFGSRPSRCAYMPRPLGGRTCRSPRRADPLARSRMLPADQAEGEPRGRVLRRLVTRLTSVRLLRKNRPAEPVRIRIALMRRARMVIGTRPKQATRHSVGARQSQVRRRRRTGERMGAEQTTDRLPEATQPWRIATQAGRPRTTRSRRPIRPIGRRGVPSGSG